MKNSFDLIDAMGPNATREDYAWVAATAQRIADDDEFWEKEDD